MSGNIRRLKVIAEGLSDLLKDVVFVGGAVAELYADDPANDNPFNRTYCQTNKVFPKYEENSTAPSLDAFSVKL